MQTIEELHPISITIYFMAVMGIAMFSTNPIMMGLSMTGAILYFLTRNGKGHFKMHLSFVILFTVLALMNPLVSHNGITVLFVVNDNPITLEAFLYGLNSATMIISILYWLRLFSMIMTSEKILCVFGAISPKIALVLSMSLRFVPLFQNQAKKVNDSQKAVGYFQSDNIIDSIHQKMRVFDIVLTWALENGIITANSMEARGYSVGKRSHFSIHPIRKNDIILMLITCILSGVCISAMAWGKMTFLFYPEITAPETDLFAVGGMIGYGILVLLPSIIQKGTEKQWNYLQSKI
ncbi:MAG TPA: cobalt transport protein [Ruminococcus sp.]|nr:cobalt transport protein [Ruminococcus sp.]